MTFTLTRQQALKLLRKYNKEEFHILHGLTVEGVMRWYAKEQGYKEEEEYWGQVGFSMTLTLNCIRKNTARRPQNFCRRRECPRR